MQIVWEGTHQIVNSGALAGVAQLVGASSRKPKGCGVLLPVGVRAWVTVSTPGPAQARATLIRTHTIPSQGTGPQSGVHGTQPIDASLPSMFLSLLSPLPSSLSKSNEKKKVFG